MSRVNAPVYSLSGGQVSRLALGRVDLPRMAVCGEIVKNWLCSTLGWMGIRPGSEYLGAIRNNLPERIFRFVGTAAQSSLLELTDTKMRIWNDGALVTRTAVDTTIANGSFATLAGWTTVPSPSGSVTASGSGTAYIVGSGLTRSKLRQAITVPILDAGAEHGISVTVGYGPVFMRIGTTAGDDNIVKEMELNTGSHRLAVNLTGTLYLEFSAPDAYRREVGPVSIDGAGVLEVTSPWAEVDLPRLRLCQEGDVLFAACRGYPQKRIVGRGRRSWSIEEYRAIKGPFKPPILAQIPIAPSGKLGGITLTASGDIFKPGHVGALWELVHTGQDEVATVAADSQYTGAIRVTGVDSQGTDQYNAHTGQRTFHVKITGTWTGTITLERSFGTDDAFGKFATYTANAEGDVNDTNDNAIVFWRLGFAPGGWASGSATVELVYAGGTTVGRVRITAYTSPTVVSAEVTDALGGTTPTAIWREGYWSGVQGYPRDARVHDGRLWWLGVNYLFGSVSDDYINYDDATTGDSGPVVRSIATGPADGNLWMLRLFNVIVGSATAINVVRSSAIDEPITPTQFSAREVDQLGAADIVPESVGQRGVYVGRNGIDLFEIAPGDSGDYAVQTLMRLVPDIAAVGIVRIGVQRRPDPRIHCVLADGTMAIMTYNREENVLCWTTFETDGLVEDVQVLPNLVEDDVYIVVKRTLNGVARRCLERRNYERDTRGAATTRLADCGRLATSVDPTASVSGAADFNGKTIVAWANGKGYEGISVIDGSFTLPVATTSVWYGLPYTAQFKSTKLAYAATQGSALMQKKRVDHLALLMDSTVRKGVRFGPSFDRLDSLPLVVRGAEVDPTVVEDEIDDVGVSFAGEWSTDSRFILEARAPFPCIVKGVEISVTTHDAR